ncbi:MAG: hypothetical protein H7256_15235 [Bdellovibrio sp.]|nr:hypothetical protein [Bdellovibrio sp.]
MTNKVVIAALLSMMAFQVSAQGLEECSPAFKPLYMEIQIYNRTEKMNPNDGVIGRSLQSQIENLKSDELNMKQKVQSLETGFARCEMALSSDDILAIDMEVEQFAKMKIPLMID